MDGIGFLRDDAGKRLVFRPEDTERDLIAQGMILHRGIPGLLKAERVGAELHYDISGLTPVSGVLSETVSAGRIVRILAGICDTVLKAKEYLISASQLVFEAELVFTDGQAVRMVCLPVREETRPAPDILRFFKDLVYRANCPEESGRLQIGRMIAGMNGMTEFSAEEFLRFLEPFREEDVGMRDVPEGNEAAREDTHSYGGLPVGPSAETILKAAAAPVLSGKQDAGKLTVKLFSGQDLRVLFLPEKAVGQYWLTAGAMDREERLAGIEGRGGTWRIRPCGSGILTNEEGVRTEAPVLYPHAVYIFEKPEGKRFLIFAEPLTADRASYRKYIVPDGSILRIGSAPDSDICCRLPLVSPYHAELCFSEGRFRVTDKDSRTGLYVNGQRTRRSVLKPGDDLEIMGLRIIPGEDVIALNCPDGLVEAGEKLLPYPGPKTGNSSERDEEAPEMPVFYRSVRLGREIETARFKIDPPPPSPEKEELPLFLALGSSMAMGMMSLVLLVSAVISRQVLSVVSGAAMFSGSFIFPLATRSAVRKRTAEKARLRKEKYREYLDKISEAVRAAAKEQEEILTENLPDGAACLRLMEEVSPKLWERTAEDHDFLTVRIGTGEQELQAEFDIPQQRFRVEPDELEEEMQALAGKRVMLENVPLGLSLLRFPVVGAAGPKEKTDAFVKSLVLQLASQASPDELRMAFLLDPADLGGFGFVRWLPHCSPADGGLRLIITNRGEAREVSDALLPFLEEGRRAGPQDGYRGRPHIVIFSLSRFLAERTEIVREFLRGEKAGNMSMVCAAGTVRELPSECIRVVELSDSTARLSDRNDPAGRIFLPEYAPSGNLRTAAVKLANLRPAREEAAEGLPDRSPGFLEMYGVGRAEHLNALDRWRENNPSESLQVPVGADAGGGLFLLDLHEKAHGPHGLVAGMTGSGKSEFLASLILSLAVSFDPRELSFILIDYKGGGMARAFEKLPHTAGIITNLDGGEMRRSLVSVRAELKRRQKLFAEAGKSGAGGNMDIYRYQQLYREGKAAEALPHLFIIADEFAELKSGQPEFMSELVSAARIGRSLGIHLILATQKPSGVVDDQIWSNSRFRICLKVQERQDSMDMLRRPDAAALRDPGRFYLQVGFNELFETGQSAYTGALYEPSDRPVSVRDESVAAVGLTGKALREARPGPGIPAGGKKQLEAVTEYLCGIAEAENIRTRPLWLPPLSEEISPETLRKKYALSHTPYTLNPLIGEYDDPEAQEQGPLTLPLSEKGNAVLYGAAGSGKTEFVGTLVYSMISECGPEELNLYLADFGAGTLKAFRDAPQVGDLILPHEKEKAAGLFRLLNRAAEERRQLFAEYGGDYDAYISASGRTLPRIAVVLHNYAAFSETCPELEEALMGLLREGTKYGIVFLLTCSAVNGIRYRLLQYFGTQLVLQMNDVSDYAAVLGRTDGLVPSKAKGRGLVRRERVTEFQTARISADGAASSVIRESCRRMKEAYGGETARKIPVMPEVVDAAYLADFYGSETPLLVPVGVEKETLFVRKADFGRSYISLVLSAGEEFDSVLGVVAELAKDRPGLELMPCGPAGLLPAGMRPDCERVVDELFETVVSRHNAQKDAAESGEKPRSFGKVLVLIFSLSALREELTAEGKEKLSLVLERGRKELGVHLVIGESAAAAAALSRENWFRRNISGSEGLFVGGNFDSQYILRPAEMTAEMRRNPAPGFGWAVRKGTAVQVRFPLPPEESVD